MYIERLDLWLLLLILAGIAIFFSLKWWKERTIKRWRRALAVNEHYAVYQQLYANLDGFALSRMARVGCDALEYVYGEINFESFIALLSLCRPNPSSIFYDLGSGTGKAVLACTMVFDIERCYGIELFSTLNKSAKLQQKRLREIPRYQEKADRVEFIQADFLDTPFDDATLIFINATAFFGETWLTISKHVEQVKPDTLVISTSKALHSNLFEITTVTQVTMSWGIVDAFIQRRINLC